MVGNAMEVDQKVLDLAVLDFFPGQMVDQRKDEQVKKVVFLL